MLCLNIFYMKTEEYRIIIKKCDVGELDSSYKKLIETSFRAAEKAYAPYSSLRIGAAVLLESGLIESASNQENIAYPSGMCAERVVLNYVTSKYINDKIIAMAIVSPDSDKMITPCGACRQVMNEIVKRNNADFEVIIVDSGTANIINAGNLLPLAFDF